MLILNTVNINSENFQSSITSKEKSIIYIKAAWCGPCKMLSPIIDEISSEIGSEVLIGKMDADENMDLCKELNVRNIPTLLFYKNGELVDRSVGAKSKSDILKWVESF